MQAQRACKGPRNSLERARKSISCKSIYFLGGEDVKERDCVDINRELFDEVKRPRIVVIPWTTRNLEKERRYREIIHKYFLDLGAESVAFLERYDSTKDVKDKIEQANILYLPGGDPRVLYEEISRRDYLRQMAKEFKGIIVGNSAGAMVLGREALFMEGGCPEIIECLRLVEFCIHPHYTVDVEEHILTFSRNKVVFAIPSRNAIIYRSPNIFEIIGEVSLFIEGKNIGTFHGRRCLGTNI